MWISHPSTRSLRSIVPVVWTALVVAALVWTLVRGLPPATGVLFKLGWWAAIAIVAVMAADAWNLARKLQLVAVEGAQLLLGKGPAARRLPLTDIQRVVPAHAARVAGRRPVAAIELKAADRRVERVLFLPRDDASLKFLNEALRKERQRLRTGGPALPAIDPREEPEEPVPPELQTVKLARPPPMKKP